MEFRVKYRSLILTTVSFVLFLSVSYVAQAGSLFDDWNLEGHTGPYLVIKNKVNVRAAPNSKAEKISQLPSREIVTVHGRAKGTQWLAVSKKGNNLGFVYASSLTPMIDASLNDPITGKIDLSDDKKATCDYNINFEGRAIEEETIFVSADYQVAFQCAMDEEKFTFNALMFMSEVPPDLGRNPIYQVTLNLPHIATGYEEYLSATALFNQENGEVIMDNVSLDQFKEKEVPDKHNAQTPAEAIKVALQLQLSSFNRKAWRIIAGKIPNPSALKPQ